MPFFFHNLCLQKWTPKEKIYIIPEATWVIFECDGYFQESIQTIFKRFLTGWLPFFGYKYAVSFSLLQIYIYFYIEFEIIIFLIIIID